MPENGKIHFTDTTKIVVRRTYNKIITNSFFRCSLNLTRDSVVI